MFLVRYTDEDGEQMDEECSSYVLAANLAKEKFSESDEAVWIHDVERNLWLEVGEDGPG